MFEGLFSSLMPFYFASFPFAFNNLGTILTIISKHCIEIISIFVGNFWKIADNIDVQGDIWLV